MSLAAKLRYTKDMRLKRLTLATAHFEDYLTFFSEVLELELVKLTDDSMELDLLGIILEIRKGDHPVSEQSFEFSLLSEEFAAIVQKISFFYYRKGPTRFLLVDEGKFKCDLIDPDGRLWRFSQPAFTETHFSQEALR